MENMENRKFSEKEISEFKLWMKYLEDLDNHDEIEYRLDHKPEKVKGEIIGKTAFSIKVERLPVSIDNDKVFTFNFFYGGYVEFSTDCLKDLGIAQGSPIVKQTEEMDQSTSFDKKYVMTWHTAKELIAEHLKWLGQIPLVPKFKDAK